MYQKVSSKNCQMFRQAPHYMDNSLSKTQGSSRKGYNTQYYLLKMLEKMEISFKKTFGALLKDSSKVFDCLSHDLLHAKLHTHGFSLSALKLIQSFEN